MIIREDQQVLYDDVGSQKLTSNVTAAILEGLAMSDDKEGGGQS